MRLNMYETWVHGSHWSWIKLEYYIARGIDLGNIDKACSMLNQHVQLITYDLF
jgi:hypothetical protein